MLAAFWSEVRYAARGMMRSPGVPGAIILTLPLGIAGVLWLAPAGIAHLGTGARRIDRAAVLFGTGVAAAVTLVIGLVPPVPGARWRLTGPE